MKRLQDKVALITGGGSGIGRAIALAFAGEGAHVCVVGRTFEKVKDTEKDIEKIGQKALAIQTDITRLTEINKMVGDVTDFFGRLDILVNNAGIVIDNSILDVTESQWDEIMGVDLKWAFFVTKSVLPIMISQGKGKIINIASPLGIKGKPMSSVYCAAKGGIINLTRALAKELAQKNINVNAIGPGFTDTPMIEKYKTNPELLKRATSNIPFGRPAKPEEIGGAAIFLASDESDFITGAILFVDGGETA